MGTTGGSQHASSQEHGNSELQRDQPLPWMYKRGVALALVEPALAAARGPSGCVSTRSDGGEARVPSVERGRDRDGRQPRPARRAAQETVRIADLDRGLRATRSAPERTP